MTQQGLVTNQGMLKKPSYGHVAVAVGRKMEDVGTLSQVVAALGRSE